MNNNDMTGIARDLRANAARASREQKVAIYRVTKAGSPSKQASVYALPAEVEQTLERLTLLNPGMSFVAATK